MTIDSFPDGVADLIKWYVYRLIDPRNGETFYVGKGKPESTEGWRRVNVLKKQKGAPLNLG